MWRKKGHLKVAEKNRKWRKKILELAGDQSQNMVTMHFCPLIASTWGSWHFLTGWNGGRTISTDGLAPPL